MIQVKSNSVPDIYSDESYREAMRLVNEFSRQEGRRPRILLTQMGWDERRLKAKSISAEYAEIGFDVDIGPRFQNPSDAAKQAVENDVHFIEIYDLDHEYLVIASEIISELRKMNREDILVIAEGCLNEKDYGYLYSEGVAAIINPAAILPRSVIELMHLLLRPDQGRLVS
jgi:methylmalonyl-CoA mutase